MTRTHKTLDADLARATPALPVGDEEADWDEITESSWESFPASDPPSWAGQGSRRRPRPLSADR